MDKEFIIKKARPLFYEYGIKDVSLKQIANECDTTVSLITYYFGSKADLAEAVYMQYFNELVVTIENKYYENKIIWRISWIVCPTYRPSSIEGRI